MVKLIDDKEIEIARVKIFASADPNLNELTETEEVEILFDAIPSIYFDTVEHQYRVNDLFDAKYQLEDWCRENEHAFTFEVKRILPEPSFDDIDWDEPVDLDVDLD